MSGKLAAAAHFVVASCQASELGATKLNKVLWFADCEMYRRTGRTITGDRLYIRKKHGPCAHGLEAVLSALRDEGLIYEEGVPAGDKVRREMYSLEAPDPSLLTREEQDILCDVADRIRKMTAEEASDLSHDELWRNTDNGAYMDVAAGAVVVTPLPAERMQWVRERFG